jgi:hypothetical protein
LVASPELWAWSSFRAYARGETGPVRVNTEAMLSEQPPRQLPTHVNLSTDVVRSATKFA